MFTAFRHRAGASASAAGSSEAPLKASGDLGALNGAAAAAAPPAASNSPRDVLSAMFGGMRKGVEAWSSEAANAMTRVAGGGAGAKARLEQQQVAQISYGRPERSDATSTSAPTAPRESWAPSAQPGAPECHHICSNGIAHDSAMPGSRRRPRTRSAQAEADSRTQAS